MNTFNVKINIHYNDQAKIEIFQSWLNIWCSSYCSAPFVIKKSDELREDCQLVACFENKTEASMFALSSGQFDIDVVA